MLGRAESGDLQVSGDRLSTDRRGVLPLGRSSRSRQHLGRLWLGEGRSPCGCGLGLRRASALSIAGSRRSAILGLLACRRRGRAAVGSSSFPADYIPKQAAPVRECLDLAAHRGERLRLVVMADRDRRGDAQRLIERERLGLD